MPTEYRVLELRRLYLKSRFIQYLAMIQSARMPVASKILLLEGIWLILRLLTVM